VACSAGEILFFIGEEVVVSSLPLHIIIRVNEMLSTALHLLQVAPAGW
jgi:hypothetical protein